MQRRFRALVIFAAFTGLRWGELVVSACEMLILTPERCTLCESSLNCRTANEFRAGRSRMPVPHSRLATSAGGGGTRAPDRVPTERSGGPDLQGADGGGVAANNFHRSVRWAECVAEAGLPCLTSSHREAPSSTLASGPRRARRA